MDPISVVGVASAAAQMGQFIAQTIQGLCTLRDKFKDANTTIRLLIKELSTIRTMISQLHDWAEWNACDSPKEEEYMRGIEVALEGAPIRRWLSSSSSSSSSTSPSPSSSSSQVNRFGKKSQIWSGFSRLNTSSSSSLKGSSRRVQPLSPTHIRQRGLKGQETNLNQSIDFGSIDGLETPALVRAAQAGSRVEVERLIDHGHDIEAFHVSSHRTALAVAAHCGNAVVVETLVQLNAKLNSRDHTLSTPLHLAASRGHRGVVEVLLNEGVQLEETDVKGMTALWVAVERGYFEVAELLLQKGAKANTRAEGQLTPLHVAAQRGDAEMVELLLRHGAHIEARDSQFMAALHYACETGYQQVVDILLNKGASIEALGVNGKSPMICAAAEGHSHIVEFLLRKKASIRSKDERDCNALHWAAYHGHIEVADLLLRRKQSINERNADGWTPLHLAVIGSHFSAVEFLLRMDATLEPQCQQGMTPMHYACGLDDVDIVRILIGAGVRTEATIPVDLRRPIHIAASKGSIEIVQLLCEKGVAIDTRDSAGDRPLCLAAFYGHTGVAEILLDFKAPLRLPFSDRSYEDSPLCVAVKEGHLEVVSLLLQRGASVRQKDELGWPPIRYAAHYGHPEILELLLTQAATFSDDVTDAYGLDYIAENIGFNVTSSISEERKGRVRELLSQSEDQVSSYMAERTIRVTAPVSLNAHSSQHAEIDPAYNPQEMATNLASSEVFRSRTVSAPKPKPIVPNPPRYQPPAYDTNGSHDGKIDPTLSRHDSTATMDSPADSLIPQNNHNSSSRSGTISYRPSTTPISSMSPGEAALLIEDKRNEIAQLQQFLPSIDEGYVHELGGYYAPVSAFRPTFYELPTVERV